jgi:hypothetical protein
MKLALVMALACRLLGLSRLASESVRQTPGSSVLKHCSRRIRIIILGAIVALLTRSLAAQESPLAERNWKPAAQTFCHGDVGYPIRASGGITAVIGRSRRLNGYESLLRGVVVGFDVGVVNVGARFGWARLRPYMQV